MNRTDNEIIAFFKENENNLYKLKSIYTELVKSQRYSLAKLYKNKIEVLEYLEKFELDKGWISAKKNPPKNNENVVVRSFSNDEDYEEEIAYYENNKWYFYNDAEYPKEVLYYFIYPTNI